MRAIQFEEYGGPDVLRLVDVDAPQPREGEVRVAVRAAGVNPFDWKLRSGAMAEAMPVTLPRVPGLEFAGVVEAAGPSAAYSAGAEVFGWSVGGSYAEYVRAKTVTSKPAELSWNDAAGLPVAGEAAVRVLEELRVDAGEVVVIHGASGAVGMIATQVAVHRGATVIGTASSHRQQEVRALGATPTTYGDGLADRIRALAPVGIDAAFDAAGHGALPALVDLAGGTERVVTIADSSAEEMGVRFSSSGTRTSGLLAELAELVVSGVVRLPRATRLSLDEAAEAHRVSEQGRSGGKLILVP